MWTKNLNNTKDVQVCVCTYEGICMHMCMCGMCTCMYTRACVCEHVYVWCVYMHVYTCIHMCMCLFPECIQTRNYKHCKRAESLVFYEWNLFKCLFCTILQIITSNVVTKWLAPVENSKPTDAITYRSTGRWNGFPLNKWKVSLLRNHWGLKLKYKNRCFCFHLFILFVIKAFLANNRHSNNQFTLWYMVHHHNKLLSSEQKSL